MSHFKTFNLLEKILFMCDYKTDLVDGIDMMSHTLSVLRSQNNIVNAIQQCLDLWLVYCDTTHITHCVRNPTMSRLVASVL